MSGSEGSFGETGNRNFELSPDFRVGSILVPGREISSCGVIRPQTEAFLFLETPENMGKSLPIDENKNLIRVNSIKKYHYENRIRSRLAQLGLDVLETFVDNEGNLCCRVFNYGNIPLKIQAGYDTTSFFSAPEETRITQNSLEESLNDGDIILQKENRDTPEPQFFYVFTGSRRGGYLRIANRSEADSIAFRINPEEVYSVQASKEDSILGTPLDLSKLDSLRAADDLRPFLIRHGYHLPFAEVNQFAICQTDTHIGLYNGVYAVIEAQLYTLEYIDGKPLLSPLQDAIHISSHVLKPNSPTWPIRLELLNSNGFDLPTLQKVVVLIRFYR
jgi:hypothetical protein